jgi:cytochrome c oxidase cbb3-type subunit I/II
MIKLGVPYEKDYASKANDDLLAQGKLIQASLKKDNIDVSEKDEIVAIIAYLQRLGTDIEIKPTTTK